MSAIREKKHLLDSLFLKMAENSVESLSIYVELKENINDWVKVLDLKRESALDTAETFL